jgi:hypothetical protein
MKIPVTTLHSSRLEDEFSKEISNLSEETMNRKSTFLLSVFLLLSLLMAPVGSAAALTAPNLIQDPSLQASYHTTLYWQQSSSNADWTVCSTSDIDCVIAGVTGARTGTRWAMFGVPDWDAESTNPEVATLTQTVTFPTCGTSLQFYLWIGQAAAGSDANDVFNVKVDGSTVFSRNATHAASFSSYQLVTVNLDAYANGAAHTIQFHSVTSGQAVIFNLDDISLTRTCVTISGNAGIAGADVNYAGSTNGSTIANGSGAYSFNVPFDWSGTVTPSKTGYSFAPTGRTYANLGSDQTGQNYTATAITYLISGNVGKPGVTLSYSDAIARTATSDSNGDYSFSVSYNWSGTVTPSHPCFTFTPANRPYANVLANQTSQNYTPTPILAAGCVDINVSIAGNNEGTFSIAEQGTLTQAPIPGVNSGPVKLDSTVSMIGGERVIYKVNGIQTSFTEMLGLPNGQLDTTYYLPWYNNVDLDTQLRIANATNSSATMHIFIGGTEVTPVSGMTLLAGESTRVSYAGVNNGPVQIESTQDIVAAERVIYKVAGKHTSFTEMMALPASQLDTTYWLPWYNNVDLDTQLRIGNVSNATATVHVFIGGAEVTPVSGIPLLAGESTRVSYAGVNDGPVKIVSDQDIVAAERVIYKVNGLQTSFSEMMALPASQVDTTYWFPRYNNIDLDTQLRLANVSGSTATVHIFVGGTEVTPVSGITLLAGESTRVSYTGINGGLVKVESDFPIVAAERVIYKVNGIQTSFSEMMGLPASRLDTIYWLPWYNNVDLDTQLRFGLP